MNRQNFFMSFLMLCCSMMLQAQDVIVKRDGSTILSKVLEVNQNDIKYKKSSNPKGPTYAIDKAEVMAINYEGGDRDTFDEVRPTQIAANDQVQTTSFGVNPNLEEDNLKLVREYNAGSIKYIGNKGNKECYYYIGLLKVKEGSVLETPEIKMDFSLNDAKCPKPSTVLLLVTLKNKTNKTVYIDLANCFFMQGSSAQPYYIQSTTTTGTGGTTGASINLGSVTGSLGIGGALGTLSNGVNVGGSKSNMTTTTTFSQRIIAIPPKAVLPLEAKCFCEFEEKFGMYGKNCRISSSVILQHAASLLEKGLIKEDAGYYKVFRGMLKRGEVLNLPETGNDDIAIFVTYAFDEQMSNTQTMRSSLYWAQIIGDPAEYYDGFGNSDFEESSMSRMCFRIWGGKLMK